MDRDTAREPAPASLAVLRFGAPGDPVTLVTRSDAMRRRLALAMRAATGDIPVLLTGESGTGKELLARAIHAASRRSDRPFVAVNCAAIPDGLLESELFGYRRGAFTGAVADKPGLLMAAHGGTLLLDEVADMPAPLQAKLLRVLEDGRCPRLGDVRSVTLDVRIVSATNAVLEDRVRAGTFRQDLYYRLAAFRIHIPALRERPEDVETLARHFIEREAERLGRPIPVLTDEALDALRTRRSLLTSCRKGHLDHRGAAVPVITTRRWGRGVFRSNAVIACAF